MTNINISEYLFNVSNTKEKEIKIYNLFQRMDNLGDFNKIIKDDQTNFLSTFISDNYDKMDIDEMKNIVLKCVTDNGIKHILLDYELSNLKYETKNISLNEFKTKATYFLNRYKMVGFQFRNNWILLNNDTTLIQILDNEIIFMNTIDEKSFHSDENAIFLQNIIRLLSRISFRVKVSIHSKFIDRDKIYYVFIKCVEIKFV